MPDFSRWFLAAVVLVIIVGAFASGALKLGSTDQTAAVADAGKVYASDVASLDMALQMATADLSNLMKTPSAIMTLTTVSHAQNALTLEQRVLEEVQDNLGAKVKNKAVAAALTDATTQLLKADGQLTLTSQTVLGLKSPSRDQVVRIANDLQMSLGYLMKARADLATVVGN